MDRIGQICRAQSFGRVFRSSHDQIRNVPANSGGNGTELTTMLKRLGPWRLNCPDPFFLSFLLFADLDLVEAVVRALQLVNRMMGGLQQLQFGVD